MNLFPSNREFTQPSPLIRRSAVQRLLVGALYGDNGALLTDDSAFSTGSNLTEGWAVSMRVVPVYLYTRIRVVMPQTADEAAGVSFEGAGGWSWGQTAPEGYAWQLTEQYRP